VERDYVTERDMGVGSASPATPEVPTGDEWPEYVAEAWNLIRREVVPYVPLLSARIAERAVRELDAAGMLRRPVDRSGVAGEPEATTENARCSKPAWVWLGSVAPQCGMPLDDRGRCSNPHPGSGPQIAVAAAPTPVYPDTASGSAAAVLAGAATVSAETVEVFKAAIPEERHGWLPYDEEIRVGLAAAAPLIAAQALRSAYWKLREHASRMRSTEVYRRCVERAEYEQGDNAREYQRYRWLEATARGIEDGAQDLAEMFGIEECEIEPRADELERGADRG
jgi:hypothetical protein